jgi:hypothetical protein
MEPFLGEKKKSYISIPLIKRLLLLVSFVHWIP